MMISRNTYVASISLALLSLAICLGQQPGVVGQGIGQASSAASTSSSSTSSSSSSSSGGAGGVGGFVPNLMGGIMQPVMGGVVSPVVGSVGSMMGGVVSPVLGGVGGMVGGVVQPVMGALGSLSGGLMGQNGLMGGALDGVVGGLGLGLGLGANANLGSNLRLATGALAGIGTGLGAGLSGVQRAGIGGYGINPSLATGMAIHNVYKRSASASSSGGNSAASSSSSGAGGMGIGGASSSSASSSGAGGMGPGFGMGMGGASSASASSSGAGGIGSGFGMGMGGAASAAAASGAGGIGSGLGLGLAGAASAAAASGAGAGLGLDLAGAAAAGGAIVGGAGIANQVLGRQALAMEAMRNAQGESALAGSEMAAHGANNAYSASLASNAYRQAKIASARDRVNIAGTVQNSARISDAAIATHDAATKAEDSLLGSELAVDSAATVLDSDAAYIPPVTSSLLRSLPYGRIGIRNIIPKPLTYPSQYLPDVWLNGKPVNYLDAPVRMYPYAFGPNGPYSTINQAFGVYNGQPFMSNNGLILNGMVYDPACAYAFNSNLFGVVGGSIVPILANGQLEAQDEVAMANLLTMQQLNGAGMSTTYQGYGRLNPVPMITGSVSDANLVPTTTIGTTYPIGSALVIEPRDSFFQDYNDNASSRQNMDERQQ